MAYAKRVIKLSAITEFLSDRKILERGENAVESGHVRRMDYDPSLKMIRGDVHASMRNVAYKVEIDFDDAGVIKSASCKCPRGIKCHHIAALLVFAHDNISITDKECSWIVMKCPTGDVKTADELYPTKSYRAVDRQATDEELSELLNILGEYGLTVGFTWLLREEVPEAVNSLIPTIEDIITTAEFYQSDNKIELLKKKSEVTHETILKIAEATIGQRHNENWFLIRKFRLTASNFGAILAALGKNRIPKSLFKNLFGMYNLEGVKAIQWGATHEPVALKQFEEEFGYKVEPTGIWLTSSGVLGASPDGLVGDDSTIEIKCPYSFREHSLTEKLLHKKDYIIYFENGSVEINKTHNYYHQIQGTLHILDRSQCYLVIWTPNEMVSVIVARDEEWAVNLEKLEEFYFQTYIPKLINDTYSALVNLRNIVN